MLTAADRTRPRPAPRRRASGFVIALTAAAAAVTGCARPPADTAPITIASAYVMQVGAADRVDVYLVIQNSGSADRLLSATSSAGGTIALHGPGQDGQATARTLAALRIPGHSLFRLDPDGAHLVITRPRAIRQGTDITLTLVFARAGRVRVAALVTNPQTSNSGYFGP